MCSRALFLLWWFKLLLFLFVLLTLFLSIIWNSHPFILFTISSCNHSVLWERSIIRTCHITTVAVISIMVISTTVSSTDVRWLRNLLLNILLGLGFLFFLFWKRIWRWYKPWFIWLVTGNCWNRALILVKVLSFV